jgi:hypothetical protein
MPRRRVVIAVALVILVLAAGFGVYATLPSWWPRATTLVISPEKESAVSNSSVLFAATVKAGSTVVAGGTITWSVTNGSLDRTDGPSVIYTAPSCTSNVTATLSASFGGSGVFQPSSAVAQLTIYPKPSGNQGQPGNNGSKTYTGSILPYLYTLTFNSASMTNVRISGPVTLNGTSVSVITSDSANILGFNLNRFGIAATTVNASGLTLYATAIKTSSSAFGGQMAINGNSTTSLGPVSSASFGGATISIVRIEATSASFTGLTLTSSYVGGSLPYLPSLLSTPSATVDNGYALHGPVTYLALNNEAMNLTVGKLSVQQFVFEHPTAYALDRSAESYTATNAWLLDAGSATATNIQAYVLYFHVVVMGFAITASGGDYVTNVIPAGMSVGTGFSSTDTKVHVVYFSAAELTLNGLVISIE